MQSILLQTKSPSAEFARCRKFGWVDLDVERQSLQAILRLVHLCIGQSIVTISPLFQCSHGAHAHNPLGHNVPLSRQFHEIQYYLGTLFGDLRRQPPRICMLLWVIVNVRIL